MNIALVILHADPARGGAERYTFDLASSLATAGHQVTLLASSFGPHPDQVTCTALRASGLTRLRQYNRFLDSLDAHLASHSYDLVHAMLPVRRCDLYHPHAGVAADALDHGHQKHRGALLQLGSRISNQLNLKRRRFVQVERELLTGPNPPVVLCLSEYVKEALRRYYPLADDRMAKLFNAVDLARFNPEGKTLAGVSLREQLGLKSDAIVALMLAQDFERKGLREAIEAVAQVHDPRLVLLVAGKPDPSPFQAHARKLNVANQVLFAGPTTDPYAFYRAADFFVLPTRHDPCSLVVLEALAMGLPVISTRQNGACEIMTDGHEGFILPNPADVSRLAGSIKTLLDPAMRLRMHHAALALRPRLSYETHLSEVMAGYERAVARAR